MLSDPATELLKSENITPKSPIRNLYARKACSVRFIAILVHNLPSVKYESNKNPAKTVGFEDADRFPVKYESNRFLIFEFMYISHYQSTFLALYDEC